MQVIIDDRRQHCADSLGLCQVFGASAQYALQAAEMPQQFAPLGRPQTRYGFEDGFLMTARAALAVSGDGKAMRFIAHPLDDAQSR